MPTRTVWATGLAICLLSVMARAHVRMNDGLQSAQTGKISGVILDRTTQQPLSDANVTLLNTSFGTIASDEGRFLLERVPIGIYTLRVSLRQLFSNGWNFDGQFLYV